MECADDVSAVKSSTQQLMPDGIATKRRAPLSRAETMSAVMRGFRTAVIRAVASAACRPHPPAASPACATHRSALAVSSATASFSPLLPGSHATQMLARRACSSRAVVLDKLFMDKPRSLEVLSDSVSGEHAKEPGFLLKMALKMGGFYRCARSAPRILLCALFPFPGSPRKHGVLNSRRTEHARAAAPMV